MTHGQALPHELFQSLGAPRAPAHPALLGGRCSSCGHVFFPMQQYGCERCGSDQLERFAIAGRGRLITSAKVWLHSASEREAPFTVGSVITDDGAVVRGLLDDASADSLRPGDVVTTLLVPDTRGASGARDLRFGAGV